MEMVERCIICNSNKFINLFRKESSKGESFQLAQCAYCGLEFINPRPDEGEIMRYYGNEYFTKRTDRGYNNYFSIEMKTEIERIIKLNLKDLAFFEFEEKLHSEKNVLDIGCAAGYFLNYLRDRGWRSWGVDLSKDCVNFARGLSLDVMHGNYLEIDFKNKFHLMTLWATIEHMHHPDLVLEKAQYDLDDNGMLYISTCRIEGISFMKLFKQRWRFYNFPEHLYFFSFQTLKDLLEAKGFQVMKYVTYGSGVGKAGSIIRKTADYMAKKFYMGDMMLISARKIRVQ
ncbi:MAG: class I SAM-dependent methyltransferase [Spirochaetota bacterium]|nr:class I SAM-dependent methyltransferase [Spirochaetota bacterium]